MHPRRGGQGRWRRRVAQPGRPPGQAAQHPPAPLGTPALRVSPQKQAHASLQMLVGAQPRLRFAPSLNLFWGLARVHGIASQPSQATHAVLWQNISLALGIKAVFLGLAVFGNASMWMAVFADMGASLLVVGNGLRLLKKGAPHLANCPGSSPEVVVCSGDVEGPGSSRDATNAPAELSWLWSRHRGPGFKCRRRLGLWGVARIAPLAVVDKRSCSLRRAERLDTHRVQ